MFLPTFLIFGGAFDPIHKGHIQKATDVLNQTGTSKCLFAPTYKNMFGKKMTSAKHRLAMIKLALGEQTDGRLIDWGFEIANKLETSTYGVIRHLFAVDPIRKKRVSYLIGGDQARDFHKWIEWEKLLDLIPFVVVSRNEDEEIPCYFKKAPHRVITTPNYDYSSTQIRQQLRDGIRPEGLTTNTLDYIERNHLYV